MPTTMNPASLSWHRRLDTRVAAGISLTVALALGTALVGTTRAVTARAQSRAAADLDSARTAFDHLVADRTEFASSQASLVATAPVFRAHLTEPQLATDTASLDAMADDYRHTIHADFAIVAGESGKWMASPGWQPGATPPESLSSGIIDAAAGRPARAVVEVGGRLFIVVSEPARFAEEVLGTLTVGLPLDDALAKRLAQETHCDVALVSGGRLIATSLSGADRAALAALVSAGATDLRDDARGGVRHVGNGQYAVGAFPLTSPRPASLPPSSELILLQDWTPTAEFIADSRHRLNLFAAAIFFPALGIGVVFSRRMMRPLQDLVAAAGDIADGNWSRTIEPSGGAETRMMANAFNEMTTSLRHWRDEAKIREDQFRQAQKMEAVGRLAGGVAHDFNNLLTAIKGYGELLAMELEHDPAKHADVAEIMKAADRGAALTRQLLAFSRREVVSTKDLSLGSIVTGVEPMLRRLLGADVSLTSAVAPDLWLVHADAGQLEQVIINLAVNARDAMPEGGRLRIVLSNVERGAEQERLPAGPYVELAVSDTGSGMSPDVASRIFEPFFTTKEVGRGTGLGLAMAYGVVEQAGGAIDVESSLGHGTTFRIYLPRATGASASVPAVAPRPSVFLGGTETILLAEDDSHLNALISRTLTRGGYRVLTASNGDEALGILNTVHDPIDLLLTDIVMPGMNGRELSELVVAARPDTRVLFMSGYSDDAVLRSGVQAETANFIQKPFSMDALATKIRVALERHAGLV